MDAGQSLSPSSATFDSDDLTNGDELFLISSITAMFQCSSRISYPGSPGLFEVDVDAETSRDDCHDLALCAAGTMKVLPSLYLPTIRL